MNVSIHRDDLARLIESEEDLEHAREDLDFAKKAILKSEEKLTLSYKDNVQIKAELTRLQGVVAGLNARMAMGNSVQLKPGHRVISDEHLNEISALFVQGMAGMLKPETHKIACIKAYRNLTGKGLFECKSLVEGIWKLPAFAPVTVPEPAKVSDTIPVPHSYHSDDTVTRVRLADLRTDDDHSIPTE